MSAGVGGVEGIASSTRKESGSERGTRVPQTGADELYTPEGSGCTKGSGGKATSDKHRGRAHCPRLRKPDAHNSSGAPLAAYL